MRISLGTVSVVVDPFVSRQGLLRVGLGGSIRSDPRAVARVFGSGDAADAVFVAHSHYDHLLDAAELLKLPGWEEVPLYGGRTTFNLLHGYGDEVAQHHRQVEADGNWHLVSEDEGGDRLEYLALPATHAPQIGCLLLYPGEVEQPRTTPPERASHFSLGEVYAFGLRLRHAGHRSTVFVLTSASDPLPAAPGAGFSRVDVAILCAASWESVTNYPAWVLEWLHPRNIVSCHYDDFFQTDRSGAQRFVPLLDYDEWLHALQRATRYPEFERLWVPDVDCAVLIPPVPVPSSP